MSAAVSKMLTALLGAVLSSLAPTLLEAIYTRAKRISLPSLPSVAGKLHADELIKSIAKWLGYSSVPALAIGALTFALNHEGDYVKNAALLYASSFSVGLIIDLIKKTYAGVDPSLASMPTPPTLPPAVAPALAEVANVPTEAKSAGPECPTDECRFRGRIVDPAA